MNKLRMQAQFVPIIAFGISCSFKESDTLNQIVQSSNTSNCFAGMPINVLQCFLKGPPCTWINCSPVLATLSLFFPILAFNTNIIRENTATTACY